MSDKYLYVENWAAPNDSKVKLNETKFNELKIQIKSAEKEKETAKKELILAKETLDSELKAAGYPNAKAVKGMLISSEKRKRMQTEIIEYDKECRDIENKIREKVESLIGKAEADNSNTSCDRFTWIFAV